jgi:hypothetical protein
MKTIYMGAEANGIQTILLPGSHQAGLDRRKLARDFPHKLTADPDDPNFDHHFQFALAECGELERAGTVAFVVGPHSERLLGKYYYGLVAGHAGDLDRLLRDPDVRTRSGQYDNYVPFANGTLSARNGIFEPHDPHDYMYIRSLANIAYLGIGPSSLADVCSS